ncbi:MAG: hypothetical protein ACRDCC_11940 [Culicoidibacterales bacterium]
MLKKAINRIGTKILMILIIVFSLGIWFWFEDNVFLSPVIKFNQTFEKNDYSYTIGNMKIIDEGIYTYIYLPIKYKNNNKDEKQTFYGNLYNLIGYEFNPLYVRYKESGDAYGLTNTVHLNQALDDLNYIVPTAGGEESIVYFPLAKIRGVTTELSPEDFEIVYLKDGAYTPLYVE